MNDEQETIEALGLMKPRQMSKWHRRRKQPLGYFATFVVSAVGLAFVLAFVSGLFNPGLSEGWVDLLRYMFGTFVFFAIIFLFLSLIAASVFYRRGIARYQQAWASGLRPEEWEQDSAIDDAGE